MKVNYATICVIIVIAINTTLFFLYKWAIPVIYDFVISLSVVMKVATLILAAAIVKYGRDLSQGANYFWDNFIFNKCRKSVANLQVGNGIFILAALMMMVTIFILYSRMDLLLIVELLYFAWFTWAVNSIFMPSSK